MVMDRGGGKIEKLLTKPALISKSGKIKHFSLVCLEFLGKTKPVVQAGQKYGATG
jgi:hypothetical protein